MALPKPFQDECTICKTARYRVAHNFMGRRGIAYLCATCDWGVTSLGQQSEPPTWWNRVTGGGS